MDRGWREAMVGGVAGVVALAVAGAGGVAARGRVASAVGAEASGPAAGAAVVPGPAPAVGRDPLPLVPGFGPGPVVPPGSGPAPAACAPVAVAAAAAPTAAQRQAATLRMAALLQGLPVYPGAVATGPSPYGTASVGSEGLAVAGGGPGPRPAMGLPDSPETVDVYRVWRTSAGASSVEAWFGAWAAGHGLRRVASASATGPTSADDVSGIAFEPVGDGVSAPQVQVTVGAGGIRYDAVEVFALPRPAGETVPAGAQAVAVTICGGIPDRVVSTSTVTAPDRIAALASAVDALPVDTRSVFNCAMDNGLRLNLAFRYASGRTATVSENVACADVAVGPGPWPALEGDLTSAIASAIGQTPAGLRGLASGGASATPALAPAP